MNEKALQTHDIYSKKGARLWNEGLSAKRKFRHASQIHKILRLLESGENMNYGRNRHKRSKAKKMMAERRMASEKRGTSNPLSKPL